jgi:hypothetical protein
MTNIFDLLCGNVHADVRDGYYDTLQLWSADVWDRAMLTCSRISDLYTKPRTERGRLGVAEQWLEYNG